MLHKSLSSATLTVSTPIGGKLLARNSYGKTWRAFTAADLVKGRHHLADPLPGQAAVLVGVSRAYVYYALEVSEHPDLRRRVEWGQVALFEAVRALHSRQAAPDFISAFTTATADELACAGKIIGVDNIFDRLIAPNI